MYGKAAKLFPDNLAAFLFVFLCFRVYVFTLLSLTPLVLLPCIPQYSIRSTF
nr:MAG TPA: hypothetical protein [Caudoviricetes sp.]